MPEINLLGVPVHIDPTFLLFAGYFAYVAGGGTAGGAVSVALALFLLILVHEGGHAVCARLQKREGIFIVIQAFGGYCGSAPGRFSNRQQVLLFLAGPAASLLFGGVALALFAADVPMPGSVPVLMNWLLVLNLFWGIFNLLPVYPMDGGQALGYLLSMRWPRQAWTWTHRLGLGGSALIALWGFSTGSLFIGIFGLLFAYQNYNALQGPGW